MLDELQTVQVTLQEAAEQKQTQFQEHREQLVSKLRRAEEGWLDGIISKHRYREIKSELTARRQSIDAELADLERHGSNRLEPMARFIKASRRAKKLASEGTPAEQRDFFRKVGSNPTLVARALVFSP